MTKFIFIIKTWNLAKYYSTSTRSHGVGGLSPLEIMGCWP